MNRTLPVLLLATTLAWPAELPVRQVVLYKHGVGFFERSGRLGPGESARLDFKASEMNDVLKSLTVEARGGKIFGLRYDAMDQLSHKLAEFPFQIGDRQPLSGMLDQLKGARLELRFGTEALTGAIVNGRLVAASGKQAEREQVTLLLDGGELRTVDLGAATGIRFTDPQLEQLFKDYLGALVASRSKEKRSVYIDSTDAREREVSASYLVPAPIWKSSYRLIFRANGQPVLEGWAIVDNTTGEDWNKVQLSLVSGRPISFVSQLYAPKYINRPEAELPDDLAARPVLHAGEFAAARPPEAVARLGGVAQQFQQVGQAGQRVTALEMPKAAQANDALRAAVNSITQAEARELGELFEYGLAQPVTIRRGESAMLPFLEQPIDGRKLLIYADHGSLHPTNALQLTNSTGKTLDGGAITVYDGGAYGGEALMETLKTGDQRLISYAVDLGTRITEAFGSKQAVVREIHAGHGILTTKSAAQEIRTYTIRNVDRKDKTLIIEHPLRQGYTLLSQKPASKTSGNYRFEVQLAPGATQEFAVAEERVLEQTYAATTLTPDVILSYARNRDLSDAGRRQLQRIADQKAQIAENDRATAAAETEVRNLNADEERIRRNIQSLTSVSGQQQQVQNYARQIEVHEQQLAALRDRQAELQKKKATLEGQLDRMVEGLAF